MEDRYKKKWLILALVWICSIGLFFFNLYKINDYQKRKESLIAKREIEKFLKSHEKQLKDISKERERYYDRVTNIKIGLLKIEERLERLLKENGLTIGKIEYGELYEGISNVEIDITCNGIITGFINMLSSMRKRFPYLEIEDIDIKFTQPMEGSFRLKVKYNFLVKDQNV